MNKISTPPAQSSSSGPEGPLSQENSRGSGSFKGTLLTVVGILVLITLPQFPTHPAFATKQEIPAVSQQAELPSVLLFPQVATLSDTCDAKLYPLSDGTTLVSSLSANRRAIYIARITPDGQMIEQEQISTPVDGETYSIAYPSQVHVDIFYYIKYTNQQAGQGVLIRFDRQTRQEQILASVERAYDLAVGEFEDKDVIWTTSAAYGEKGSIIAIVIQEDETTVQLQQNIEPINDWFFNVQFHGVFRDQVLVLPQIGLSTFPQWIYQVTREEQTGSLSIKLVQTLQAGKPSHIGPSGLWLIGGGQSIRIRRYTQNAASDPWEVVGVLSNPTGRAFTAITIAPDGEAILFHAGPTYVLPARKYLFLFDEQQGFSGKWHEIVNGQIPRNPTQAISSGRETLLLYVVGGGDEDPFAFHVLILKAISPGYQLFLPHLAG